MKKWYRNSLVLLFTALAAPGVWFGYHKVAGGPPEPAFGQESPALVQAYLEAQKAAGSKNGFTGLAEVHGKGDQPLWAIYGFAYDPAQKAYELQATVGKGVAGNETVPDLVAQIPKSKGTPVAGVNGDFFENKTQYHYLGTSEGMCIVEGELVSGPAAGTFWIGADGKARIGGVKAQFEAKWPDGTTAAFGLNCATSDFASRVKSAPVVLYTPAFGPSTQTQGGREFVLEPVDPASLPLKANKAFNAKVVRLETAGNCAIPKDGLVISVSKAGEKLVPALKEGDVVSLSLGCTPDMTGVKVGMGGGPILFRDGVMPDWVSKEGRAPRTAVGIHPDGRVEFVIVDGRQPGLSIGMTVEEMGKWMKMIGCPEAMNLDGGGSTTMWYQGKVVNSPSDGQLRKVGNALVVVRK